ncbi:MAG TPA: pitrilysin family protein [Candidatus Limnocylindria bacterium]
MIARPLAGSPRPYRFPDFEHRRLANGLGVWLVPLPERELVSIHLLTDAGAAAEDEAHAGIAALTAQLLVTGTRRLDAAAFAETTERLGIEVSSESSWDSARAGFTALGSKLDDGLALLAEMLRTPRLDPGEFDRIKAERLNDILQARADPGRLADESFLREVFAPDEPYGRLSAGTPESVTALTVEDARAFHATHYAPNVADLVIAGGIEPAAALDAIARHLGDWSGTAPEHRTFAPTQRGGRRIVLVDRPGSVQSELRVGHLGIDRHDPRFFPAMVMAALLGGVFGSRLNLRLREELGYTYGARCSFDPRRAVGPFTATAAVQTEVTVDAIRELIGQLERIGEAPPTDTELAEVRDYLVGVFPLRFETTGGIAAAIEPLAVFDLPHDWWQTYRANLEAVSPEDVHRVARELVRPDEALILLTGDASVLREELEKAELGPLEVVSPA